MVERAEPCLVVAHGTDMLDHQRCPSIEVLPESAGFIRPVHRRSGTAQTITEVLDAIECGW